MNLQRYFETDDRGVSPVIGVILMVAITVILAAVIATFVMNLGPPEDQAPTTSWSTSVNSDNLTITHDGGESVPVDELSIKVEGDSSETYAFTDGSAVSTGNTISATDSVVISVASTMPSDSIDATSEVSTNNIDDLNSVKLVWESSSADKSQTLKTWEP